MDRTRSPRARSRSGSCRWPSPCPLGILSADARGWVVFCNEAAQQIFNLSADQLMGHGWERLVDPEDLPEVDGAPCAPWCALALPQQVMFRIQTGLFVRWALAKFVPLGGPDEVTGWIATVDDVTDRRRAETELTHQATHDMLTGLPNRMLLEDRLQQACARLRREQRRGLGHVHRPRRLQAR